MRYAAKVDGNQRDIVKALRRAGVRVRITSSLGSGFADLVCYRPATGLLRLLELKDGDKSPSARKLTESEETFALEFPVWIVRSVREALAAMGIEVSA